MKHVAVILVLAVGVLHATAKAVPDHIEHSWWFFGPGGNYGVQQLCSASDPDDAWTVFAFADHFYRMPFRITTVGLPVVAGLLFIGIALIYRRWLRARHDSKV